LRSIRNPLIPANPCKDNNMKTGLAVALAVGCFVVGVAFGFGKKETAPGIDTVRGKPPQEAAASALQEAEKLAGDNSWELLGVARVYYLSGDKARGQALMDRVLKSKPEASDWLRAGEIYAEANEAQQAEAAYDKALAGDPKDDNERAQIGAWYISMGQRDKGEELLAQAFARNPEDVWHYLRAAEGFLKVPQGR
jgi:tetratricopeptide (TPR) repeat protein